MKDWNFTDRRRINFVLHSRGQVNRIKKKTYFQSKYF